MRSSNLRAILMMLAAVGLFAGMDTGLKQLSGLYPAIEVTFLRSAASMPFLLASVAWSGGWRELRPGSPLLYLLRAAIGILMLVTFIYSVRVQALTDSYAVFMSAPLMVAGLSRLVLGERVPIRRWMAITAGLLGVVLALKPTGHGLVSLGGIAAAVSAVCYALNVLSIRLMGRTDSSQSLVFWHILLIMLGAGALALQGWKPVAAHDWPVIAVIGATGAAAQRLLTSAFRRAPPSTVAPFEYTALVWGLLADYVVFSLLPVGRVVAGGVIVILAGLYLIWDESRPPADTVVAPAR